MFYRSMSEPEQRHIVAAFTFELGNVETAAVRARMLGHLALVNRALASAVEKGLGMEGRAEKVTPAVEPRDVALSPSLSLIRKAPATLRGRKVAVLVTDGSDASLVEKLRAEAKRERATLAVVAPKIGGAKGAGGQAIAVDHALSNAPSVFFDAVVLAPSAKGAEALAQKAAAVDWVRDAFGHLKAIGHVPAAAPLLTRAGVEADAGVVAIDTPRGLKSFIAAAKQGRVWDREPKVRGETER